MEHYSGSMIDIMDAEFDEAYWVPTPARHLQNMLEVAEYAVREANRTAAWQMAAIASAVEAARQAPEVYVDEVLSGSAHGRDLAVRSVVFDLSVRLRMSATTVRQLADRAERLQSRLPRCWQKIRTGLVLETNTRILSDEILGLAAEHTDAFDAALAEPATRLTPAKLRVKARTVREQLEHASRQERHERSAAERRVYIEDDTDGMAWLCLYAPAADVYRAKARIDAGATQLHGQQDETRTLAQLRADIAADLLTGAGTPAEVATSVFVTVPILNFLGQRPDGVAPEAATLEGYGPIDDDTAAHLFAGAKSFRRIGTDPISGIRLIMDRTTYRPTADQRAWLRLQYRSCAAPGCNRNVNACDLDHTLDWQHNGPTNTGNLAPLCRNDHVLKSETKIRAGRNDYGTVFFKTPTGASGNTDPPPY